MKVGFDIDTKFNIETGVIEQSTFSVVDETRELIIHQVIATREQMFREALIKLGWTPPPGTEEKS